MNVVLFGASGMVGRGVLLECLEAPEITRVLAVVRRPLSISHPKLTEIVHSDFTDYGAIGDRLRDAGACFFCLGVSSVGMKEEEYRRITYDFTIAAAKTLQRLNPQVVFCYVSGAGTDSSEKGRSMWARVKGRTENELLAMFPNAYMFRPGYIHPEKGVTSSTPLYRAAYIALWPIGRLLVAASKGLATTTIVLGRAMIIAALRGAPKKILESRDINALGRS
jgi:uncharacterized protein YbjT (DUF2867 family)